MNGIALALSLTLGTPAPSLPTPPPTSIAAPATAYAEYEKKLVEADAAATTARETDLSTPEAHAAYASAVTLFAAAYAALPPTDQASELGGDIVTLTHGLVSSQRVGAALWRMSKADAEHWLPIFDAAIELHQQHLAAADTPGMAKHRAGLADLEGARERVAQVAAPAEPDPAEDAPPPNEEPEPVAQRDPAPAETSDQAAAPSRRGLVIGLAVGGGALIAGSVGTFVPGLVVHTERAEQEGNATDAGALEDPETIAYLDGERRKASGLFVATGALAAAGLGLIVGAIVVRTRANSSRRASNSAVRFAATSNGFRVRF